MKRITILLAGAIFSLNAFGGPGDPFAEERYRMKNGRYTPAEEARQKALKPAQAKIQAACCRTAVAGAIADPASNEARYRIKNGRNTPAVEALEKARTNQTVAHIQKCIEIAKCDSMSVETQAAKTAAAASPHLKQGRLILTPEARSDSGSELASISRQTCEHECCKHAD